MECSIGSMGSRYTTCRFFPVDIPRLAKLDWNSVARRVFIDPATGVIALMSPSSTHEEYAWATNRLVDALGERIDVRSGRRGGAAGRTRRTPGRSPTPAIISGRRRGGGQRRAGGVRRRWRPSSWIRRPTS